MIRIKQIISNKSLRNYLLVAIVIMGGLLAEFIILYNYGALKIIRYVVLAASLFVIAWIDKKEHLIYNKYLLILCVIRLAILVVEWIVYSDLGMGLFTSALLGALLGGGIFWICYLFSRGGMGAGDVKIMATVGFYLGNNVILPAMVFIVVFSAIYSVIILLLKKANLKNEIPFAPFVLIGTIVTMALGF